MHILAVTTSDVPLAAEDTPNDDDNQSKGERNKKKRGKSVLKQ